MMVELIFKKNLLEKNAGEIQEIIKKTISKIQLPFKINIMSITAMSKWLVIVADFIILPIPFRSSIPEPFLSKYWKRNCFYTLGGIVVKTFRDYAVRYHHYSTLEEGKESLLFKARGIP